MLRRFEVQSGIGSSGNGALDLGTSLAVGCGQLCAIVLWHLSIDAPIGRELVRGLRAVRTARALRCFVRQ